MKPVAKSIIAVAGLSAVAAAATNALMHRPKSETPVQPPSKVAVAIETLSGQLQRRFHDRNNLTFGYERMVRIGAREHTSAVMDKARGTFTDEEGRKIEFRVKKDGSTEFEIAPGKWVDYSKVRQTLHAENDQELKAIRDLKSSGVQVAIYTAGLFDATGTPQRIKGPAYIQQEVPDAPAGKEMKSIAKEAWLSSHGTIKRGEWTYTVGRVDADDEKCIQCHSGKDESLSPPSRQEMRRNKVKMGDTLGLFLIGVKSE